MLYLHQQRQMDIPMQLACLLVFLVDAEKMSAEVNEKINTSKTVFTWF